jgi:hypothetical protein
MLFAFCQGSQPRISTRLTESQWEAIKRAGDAAFEVKDPWAQTWRGWYGETA